MCDPDATFVFLETPRIPIRRRLPGSGRTPFRPTPKDALRLLFVVSRPDDQGPRGFRSGVARCSIPCSKPRQQAVGGLWMAVNEARRGEGMPNVDGGEPVQQAVSIAPLGWMPPDRGNSGDQGSNQTGAPGEGVTATRTATRRMIQRPAFETRGVNGRG
jgi:hypothetical protein